MCIKMGNTEMSSVKALMTMSLNAIIADTFGREPEELTRDMSLADDLQMSDDQRAELAEMVAEYFDDLQLDFGQIRTLGDIFEVVVEQEFRDIPADAF